MHRVTIPQWKKRSWHQAGSCLGFYLPDNMNSVPHLEYLNTWSWKDLRSAHRGNNSNFRSGLANMAETRRVSERHCGKAFQVRKCRHSPGRQASSHWFLQILDSEYFPVGLITTDASGLDRSSSSLITTRTYKSLHHDSAWLNPHGAPVLDCY